jgi:hypothetical protein
MFLGLCLVVMNLQAQDASAPPAEPKVSVEDEVLTNLHEKDLGPVKLEALAMPDDYLRRVADRIIQSSFEERVRIVVPEPKAQPDAKSAAQPAVPAPKPKQSDDLLHDKAWLAAAGALVGLVCVWIGVSLVRKRQASSRCSRSSPRSSCARLPTSP